MAKLEGSAGPAFADLKELVQTSFPQLRCLRCGNDRFYMATDVTQLQGPPAHGHPPMAAEHAHTALTSLPIVVLACTRCGHVEQHLVDALRQAAKPIGTERP